jgi:hypothetical protein
VSSLLCREQQVYRQDYPFSPPDAEMNGLVEGPGEKWVILRIPSSVSQAILPGESHCNGQDGDKIGPPAGVLARGMSYEYLHL